MNNKGSILISIIFMMLISFIGLSMLDLSLIHNKIIKARNIQRSDSEMLHNKLTIHLHNDTEKIINKKFDTMLNKGEEFFNATNFPGENDIKFKVTKKFKFSYKELPLYRSLKGLFYITSCIPYKNHSWNSSSIFHILSGNIPFNFIPIYINTDINRTTESYYNKPKKVEFNIKSYLSSILNIDSDKLSNKSIKELLKLPGDDSFIPDGVYMVESEFETGPIIVQGDTEKILLSAGKDFQQIEIIKNKTIYKIRYFPGVPGFETENFCCDNIGYFNEKIIVNGNILCLESSNPTSLNDNSRIELIVLGNLTIGTPINTFSPLSETIHKQQLRIFVATSPFEKDKTTSEVKIKFREEGTITASVNIQGVFINTSDKLVIRGNLYCEKIVNKGTVEIEKIPGNTPLSNNNFFVKDISILKDYRIDSIEEIIGNGQ